MQNFISTIIKNKLIIIAAAILLMFYGVFSSKELPLEAFPDVSPSLVQVFTETEGLSPEDIEKYVSFPIESAMNGLPEVKKIRSVSNFGLSVVNIYFEDNTDIYFARQIVNERLLEAAKSIPEGFGTPQMGPISSSMGLILFYYLKDNTGSKSLEELRSIQDWIIKFQLQTVPGVTEILGIGGYEKQYQVIIKPEALLRYDLALDYVVKQIKANGRNVGAQYIEKNGEEYIVRSQGLYSKIDDIKKIVIKVRDGIPIYISEIAEIKVGGAMRRGLQTHNGIEEVVAGMVIKLYGTNSSTAIERVEAKIKDINKSLPEGLEIVPYYQQKTLIKKCIETVSSALFQGIALVSIIILLFLRSFRPSLIVALSIPFSVLFAVIGMKLLGITANLMSLGGLAIAIGMMVDGPIVIVENVDRYLKENPQGSFKENVTKACAELLQSIVFAILIIIIVFIPLLTLSGVEGKMFRPLAYTVSLAMLGSLIYSIFVSPVLSEIMMRVKSGSQEKEKSQTVTDNFIVAYKNLLNSLLGNRTRIIVLISSLLGIGALTFSFLGSEFTPTLQEGSLVLRLTMPPSTAMNETKRTAMRIEKRILKIPEVTDVVSRIGRGEVGAHTDPVNSAEMYITLKPRSEWISVKNQNDLENLIRAKVKNIPGALSNLTQPIKMSVDELLEGVRADLAIKLFGDDLAKLKQKADEIAKVVRKIPGAVDVQVDQIDGSPQILLEPNRAALARYGINMADIQEVISTAIGGEEAAQMYEGIKRFGILVRYSEGKRSSLAAIKRILVESPSGAKVPLSQLAKIDEIIGPRQITRENNQKFISVQTNVKERDIVSFVDEANEVIKSKVDLPAGYFINWGGQFRLQQEANKRLAIVVPITLLLVFFFLYLNFNSLRNSLLIILNIPLALVGGLVALLVSGQNLSVPSSVGFIALFGIALENGLVLVGFINQLIEEGLSLSKAIVEASIMRIRPVLMTAMTTGLGLLPLLLSSGTGSEVQRPLATVVLGGLATSTVLTLLLIPALLSLVPRKERRKMLVRNLYLCALLILILCTGMPVCAEEEVSYKNLDLTQVLSLAYDNNLGYKIAKANININKAELVTAGLRLNPNLFTDLSPPQDTYRVGFGQTFQLGGKISKRRKVIKAKSDLIAKDIENELVNLRFNTKNAFYNLYYSNKQRQVYRELLATAKKTLELAKRRESLGEVTILDVYQINLTKVQLESEYQSIRYKRRNFRNELKQILNLPHERLDIVNHVDEQETFDLDLGDFLDLAYENRPDLMKSENAIALKDRELELARAERVPNLSLELGSDVVAGDDSSVGIFLGANIDLPVFNYQQGRIKEIKAAKKQIILKRENLMNNIDLEVQNAHNNYLLAQEQLALYKTNVAQYTIEFIHKAEKSYRLGKSNIVVFTQALATAKDTNLKYIEAQRNYQMALNELEKVVNIVSL